MSAEEKLEKIKTLLENYSPEEAERLLRGAISRFCVCQALKMLTEDNLNGDYELMQKRADLINSLIFEGD